MKNHRTNSPSAFLAGIAAIVFLNVTALADTLTVMNLTDSDPGSLRATIAIATEGDTIVFDDSLSGLTIVLNATSPLVIDKGLTIDGSSLPDGITISGNDVSRVFEVFKNGGDPIVVSMSDFTIADGFKVGSGGAIDNNEELLTLTGMTLTGNKCSFRGGAINNNGVLNVFDSTFEGNQSTSVGGVINNFATANFSNCTFTGNKALDSGGSAIYTEGMGMVTLVHCTVSGNETIGGSSSAVYLNTGSTLAVENSIIAGNIPNTLEINKTAAATVLPTGVNLIGSNLTVETQFPSDGVLIGTFSAPVLPLLGMLADNGGPTRTMFPDALSPAINAASMSSLILDQRGVARPQEAGYDLGAVEDNTAELARIAKALADKQASLNRKIKKLKKQIKAAKKKGKKKKGNKLKKSLKKYLKQLKAL